MSDDRSSPDPRYGAWKFIHEIELTDLAQHPIWVWCSVLGIPDEEDGPIGGDETSMRPLLDTLEVPMDHAAPPLILLKVEGAALQGTGLFDPKLQTLEAIAVFVDGNPVPPSRVRDLPDPTVYLAIPRISGETNVAFLASGRGADSAKRSP